MSDPQPPKPPQRRPSGWLRRKIKNAGILPSTALVLGGLLLGGAIIWIFFTRLLRDNWPWQENGLETTTPGFQVMQVVLTLIGGIGAAILVVVAYRRQRDLETARFDDRFAAAAAQLGADTAAERLAGVYAMAALADTWEQHRQQCIDVLCGYLRLPYDPSEGEGLLAEVVKERTWPVGEADEHGRGEMQKETRTYRSLSNDREVRHTIIRVITEHLRDSAAVSWQGYRLDFTGAVFDGGDFSKANFSGGDVIFARTKFSGLTVDFSTATFSGAYVDFSNATFGDGVIFDEATFTGGSVQFGGAFFTGGYVGFRGATFSGGTVTFFLARFCGANVFFGEAKFFDRTAGFGGVWFSAGKVTFIGATFTGGVDFKGGRFSGSDVDFSYATFSGGQVDFGVPRKFAYELRVFETSFSGGRVDFTAAKFQDDVRVLMPSYDPDMPGWPTRAGELFLGWPPPESASGIESGNGDGPTTDRSSTAGS